MPTIDVDSWELPNEVRRMLADFVQSAQNAFGPELHSVVLYGSGAEGKLRSTSDVNVILVLGSFDQGHADQLLDAMHVAQAAIQLRPMFLLIEEIPAATEAFAQKFADIHRRRRVLYGSDPFASFSLPRPLQIRELKQRLLNLILRLRAFYVSRALQQEQLALVIADVAGPLRSCASELLDLENRRAESPKQALEEVARAEGDTDAQEALAFVSQARETRSLPPGTAARVLFSLLQLIRRMHSRAGQLS